MMKRVRLMARATLATAMMVLASGCFQTTQEAVDGLRLPQYCPFADMQRYNVFEIKDDGRELPKGSIKFKTEFDANSGARRCFVRELALLQNNDPGGGEVAQYLISGQFKNIGDGNYINFPEIDDPDSEIVAAFPMKLYNNGTLDFFDYSRAANGSFDGAVRQLLIRLGVNNAQTTDSIKATTSAQLRGLAVNSHLFKPVYRFRPVPG